MDFSECIFAAFHELGLHALLLNNKLTMKVNSSSSFKKSNDGLHLLDHWNFMTVQYWVQQTGLEDMKVDDLFIVLYDGCPKHYAVINLGPKQ